MQQNTTYNFNKLLNKLPVASAQFLTPTGYVLLATLLRRSDHLGVVTETHRTLRTVHPHSHCMMSSSVGADPRTVRSRLSELHSLFILTSDTLSDPLSINLQTIYSLVSANYADASQMIRPKHLYDPSHMITPTIRSANRSALIALARNSRIVVPKLGLSYTDWHIYDIIVSIAISLGITRIKNLPTVLIPLCVNIGRSQIYYSLEKLVELTFLSLHPRSKSCTVYEINTTKR